MWEDSSILDVVVPYLANPDSVEPLKLNFPHTWEVIAFFEGWGVRLCSTLRLITS